MITMGRITTEILCVMMITKILFGRAAVFSIIIRALCKKLKIPTLSFTKLLSNLQYFLLSEHSQSSNCRQKFRCYPEDLKATTFQSMILKVSRLFPRGMPDRKSVV